MGKSLFLLEERQPDAYGSGAWMAPRGTRKHQGIDLVLNPGERLASPVAGQVTRLGYTYSDDLSYRYVEVSVRSYRFRFFYLQPLVSVGDAVEVGDVLGIAQDLGTRYPNGITNHTHFEIRDAHGAHVDPTPLYLVAKGLVR